MGSVKQPFCVEFACSPNAPRAFQLEPTPKHAVIVNFICIAHTTALCYKRPRRRLMDKKDITIRINTDLGETHRLNLCILHILKN